MRTCHTMRAITWYSGTSISPPDRSMRPISGYTLGFYGWGSILRRWWRFMTMQERHESIPRFMIRLAVSSGIDFN